MSKKKNQMSEENLDKVSGGVQKQSVLDLETGEKKVQYGLSESEFEDYEKYRTFEEVRSVLEKLKNE